MYDFAVIGSGVSGGRMAHELTLGGARCVLIEAGRKFDRHSYPRDEMGYSTQMFWGGGIEISPDGRFGFLRGKCLGGTSVVNQADLDRFDDLAFDLWRDVSGVEWLREETFTPLYDELDQTVIAENIPREHYNRNAELFIQAFEKRGYHWKPIVRSQSDCKLDRGSDCVVCLGGCPRDSKQSTLITHIPRAVAAGLVVETECEVQQLIEHPDYVEVCARRGTDRVSFRAQRVVLAGGSFGNVAMLQQSAEIARGLPALGAAFCCHPQFMTFGVRPELIDSHKGALQSVQAHDRRLREQGIKLENVFAGPIAIGMLMPGFAAEHAGHMRNLRHLACIEVAIQDEPRGRIRMNRKGRLIPEKPLTDQDQQRIRRGLEIAMDLHDAAGTTEVIRCEQGFGLHLMGGCPLGVDPQSSVVGPDFAVHGHPRLFTADSSIFPTAPGINPSYTIMALTQLAAARLLQQGAGHAAV